MTKLLMSLCKVVFGEFEEKEFKKFLRLGSVLLMIIGIYWTMRPLKDSLFIGLVGGQNIPWAKTVSLILMIPTVAFYTKLLDMFPKIKLLGKLPSLVYGSVILVYSGFIWAFQSGMIAPSIFTVVLGYFWYFFVESFGSLIVALFWAFLAEITNVEASKKGFPLIYALAQFGGITFPYILIQLPVNIFHVKTSAVSMLLIVIMLFLINPLVKYVVRKTPKEELAAQNTDKQPEEKKKKKTSFIEGLKLLFTTPYLAGIFCSLAFFEILTTIFDFNFKYEAGQVYSGTALASYLATYSSIVNTVSFIFLILGINKITKRLGITISLVIVPAFFGLAILGFLTIQSLNFLFWLMVCSKAINYALNGPSLKQLYVPTSPEAKSKAQAWIETFGSRASKEGGSGLNLLSQVIGRASYKLLSSGLGIVFVVAWFFMSIYLGKTYKKAVKSNTNIC